MAAAPIVRARLTPIKDPVPVPSPNGPGAYGTLVIGGKQFQVLHYRDNQQMGHTDAEWQQIADQVRGLLEPRINPTLGREIDISRRGVSYLSTDADGKVTRNRIIGPEDQIVVRLMQSVAKMGIPVARPDRNSVFGSFNQSNSRYGQGLGKAACTGIDLQFAQMALLDALSNTPINRDLIDEAVVRGQMKIKDRRLRGMPNNQDLAWDARCRANELLYTQMTEQQKSAVEEYYAFDDDAHIHLPVYHPGLCQAPQLNPAAQNAPYPIRVGGSIAQDAEGFYSNKLLQLLNPAESGVPETIPVIFAGLTHGANSIGVLVYRDPGNPRAASKVVYFDSHAHALNNRVACAKTFDSPNAIQDAARFLSERMPHTAPAAQQPGQALPADPNAIQITPFHLHPFFYAQSDIEREEQYEAMTGQHDRLMQRIEILAVDHQQGESIEQRIVRGRAAIAAAADRGAFLREHVSVVHIRALLQMYDRNFWPFPPAA